MYFLRVDRCLKIACFFFIAHTCISIVFTILKNLYRFWMVTLHRFTYLLQNHRFLLKMYAYLRVMHLPFECSNFFYCHIVKYLKTLTFLMYSWFYYHGRFQAFAQNGKAYWKVKWAKNRPPPSYREGRSFTEGGGWGKQLLHKT